MISLLGPFAFRASPFSWPRFILFMSGLAAIAAVSLGAERAFHRFDDATVPVSAGDPTIVRFPQSMEDTREDLSQIGLPWFLSREGATGRTDIQSAAEIDVEVSYKGKPVGRFVERLVSLGADRSKLFVTFLPTDMSLVGKLAAPIDTPLDPVTLMRVVMAEHVRSIINGGGFNMRVLTDTPGSRWAMFRKTIADSGLCEDPQVDDFPICSQEEGRAAIRRAYEVEARGGLR